MRRVYLVLMVVLLLNFGLSCKTSTLINEEPNIVTIDEILSNANRNLSPDEKFACVLENDKQSNISSLIIVSVMDSTIVYQENNYFGSVKWLSNRVVRVFTIPEMVKKDDTNIQFFDFDVIERKKVGLDFLSR